MPTTIESMTEIVIRSPFFDVPFSFKLFPTHPKVLKTPTAPQKNRVALVYGANGSGKSTIAQGFREYSEAIVPKTVDLSFSAETGIIKMSSGMRNEKIFVFDEEYISSNISHLATAEKQRTARDVLCFMYCVNPTHVLSHLPDAQNELDNWMQSIK